MVTTHLDDGKKSLPLDVELYQHATSLPEGKEVFAAYKASLGFIWA